MPPQHHPSHQFAPWQKLSVYTTGTLLLLTGGGWLAIHYLVGAGTGELPHPLEAWTMRLHGLAAYAGLFLLGTVAAAHVPHGWRLGRRHRWAHQRRTGLTLCLLAAALAVSGYLLYYFAPEWIRPTLGWAHAAAGAAMALALALHRHGAGRSGP
jgi:hypothetical protein